MTGPDPRIDAILDLLLRLADGNHEARTDVDDSGDSLAAIMLGLNMLGEELLDADERTLEHQAQLERRTVDLERSNLDLERFAAAVAHDLGEPARHMGSFATMLMSDQGERLDERGRGWLKTIERSAGRLNRLIDGMLLYARLSQTAPEGEQVTVSEGLDEALIVLEGQLERTGAEVRVAPLPDVRVERAAITRLWQNLIGNAVKYRSEDRAPVVDIGGVREGADFGFFVSDNGIGIDPEHAERIFVVFRRLHSADKYEGAGLGLSLAQQVIERLDGRLWLDTEAQGPGSTFRFTLPGR